MAQKNNRIGGAVTTDVNDKVPTKDNHLPLRPLPLTSNSDQSPDLHTKSQPVSSCKPTSAEGGSGPGVTIKPALTPETRRLIRTKTQELIQRRDEFNRALIREFSRGTATSHRHWLKRQKLVQLHQLLQKSEKRHIEKRTKKLAELEELCKIDPKPEREADVYLVKKLLSGFKRHLGPTTMADYEDEGPSVGHVEPSCNSDSSVTSTADDLDMSERHADSVVSDSTNVTTPEKTPECEATENDKKESQTAIEVKPIKKPETGVVSPNETDGRATETSQNTKKVRKSARKELTDQPEPATSSAPVASPVETKVNAKSDIKDDKPVVPAGDKKRKKRQLDDEDDEVKPKKSKTENAPPSPASPKTAPEKADSVVTRPKDYHDQRVHDMRTNPLGYDDFVYDETRPKSKRPRFGRFGNRCPKTSLSPLMSGGLSIAAPKSPKAKGRMNDGGISKQAMKNSHNKKVADDVRSMKEAVKGEKADSHSGSNKHMATKRKPKKPSASSLEYIMSTCSSAPNMQDGSVAADDLVFNPNSTHSHFKLRSDTNQGANSTPSTPPKRPRGQDIMTITSSSPELAHSKGAGVDKPDPARAWFKRPFQCGRRQSYHLPMFSSVPAATTQPGAGDAASHSGNRSHGQNSMKPPQEYPESVYPPLPSSDGFVVNAGSSSSGVGFSNNNQEPQYGEGSHDVVNGVSVTASNTTAASHPAFHPQWLAFGSNNKAYGQHPSPPNPILHPLLPKLTSTAHEDDDHDEDDNNDHDFSEASHSQTRPSFKSSSHKISKKKNKSKNKHRHLAAASLFAPFPVPGPVPDSGSNFPISPNPQQPPLVRVITPTTMSVPAHIARAVLDAIPIPTAVAAAVITRDVQARFSNHSTEATAAVATG
ncbi:hypothetical protein B0T17DRAFT_643777 [Bombardia bombarda]|uniref:Uncharacterized protein n=1 Tax=Bombardia bombarda TaxID=252184 RepID=A0AA40BYD8_9PEZI|nr:hypothetical protein B0T17DRAFT_643777 [Bombardia bombarda]